MADIATALKAEISRLARKEIRAQLEPFKKGADRSRTQIADLRAEVATLRTQIKILSKPSRGAPRQESNNDATPSRHRYTAKGFASLRRRLELTCAEMGLLIEASDQSVRKWEDGSSTPREKFQQKIFALRDVGKKEVAARLSAIRLKTELPK